MQKIDMLCYSCWILWFLYAVSQAILALILLVLVNKQFKLDWLDQDLISVSQHKITNLWCRFLCRIWSRDLEMEPASRACALQMGNVRCSWYLHTRISDKDWNFKHPIMVHSWWTRVLHRQNYSIYCWVDLYWLGWGKTVGWHTQARVCKHWPNLP